MRCCLLSFLLQLVLHFVQPSHSVDPYTDESHKASECNNNGISSRNNFCEKTMSGSISDKPDGASFSLAVVPYDDNAVLPMYKPLVEYTFVDHKFKIKQNWAAGGVAAVVWDAAVTLCEYLESHSDLVKSKTVLEIGGGTGIVGMVSALLGADVTVTDREEALTYIHSSVSDNFVDQSKVQISVEELDWTKDYSNKFSGQFDLILGADVIYIEDLFPDLLRTLSQVSNVDTVILLSCRIRYKRDTNFLDMMRDIFSVEEILYDSERDVKIFKAVKKITRDL